MARTTRLPPNPRGNVGRGLNPGGTLIVSDSLDESRFQNRRSPIALWTFLDLGEEVRRNTITANLPKNLLPARTAAGRAFLPDTSGLETRPTRAPQTYVLRSFFLAAGNNTLFRISRYPGLFLCSDRSVGLS